MKSAQPLLRPRIITLCGSMRFRDTFEAVQKSLTLEGCIVLCPYFPAADDPPMSAQHLALLRALHLHRIDMADEVLIINPGGYTGDQTKQEMAYARQKGKPVRLLY